MHYAHRATRKKIKSVVLQFSNIFKSLAVFWSLYHESSNCPSASQALPTSTRQTRYCRGEPAKPEELMWLTRWRLARFTRLSFPRANQGKPCTTYADNSSCCSAQPQCRQEHTALHSSAQSLLGLLHNSVKIYIPSCATTALEGKRANPQILSSKTVSWTFAEISVLNIAKHSS